MKYVFSIICVLCLSLLSACSIKTPEVSFASERTALEKQILGTYRTIEEDAWMVSSTRSMAGDDVKIPEAKRAVLEAFANRKFNADDIEDFKKQSVIGENLQGLLTILPTQAYEENPDYRLLVNRIVAEENRDREIIMARIVEVYSAVDPLDHDEVTRVFGRMNRDSSLNGTMIQREDKTWTTK